MSKVNWTPAQRDAIDARDGDVLVSAAAGSGKTAVLVERIIEAVTDPVNPVSIDRMLIVTFTRAATFEMRTRIEKAIDKLLKNDPFNKYLISQKQLLYSAKILTIDGFCSDFIKQYFYKLDIRRDFRVPDDGEIAILREKALNSALEFFYQQNDKSFLDLVSAVCSVKDDNNLKDEILSIYNYLRAFPFPDDWMSEKLSLYDTAKTPFTKTPYYSYIMNYAKECLLYCLELCDTSFKYLGQDTFLDEKAIGKIRDMLEDDFATLNKLNAHIMNGDWDKVCGFVSSVKFKTFPRITGANDDEYKLLIASNRDSYKAEVKKLGALFSDSLDDLNALSDRLYPLVKALFDCVKRFELEYNALKTDKNLLEFSDIEHLAIELLCENRDGEIIYTDISEEISSCFDLIMVDEFQDINDAQNLLFKALSRDKGNLFVVGDVKQSIYGFRQAKPEIFIDYKNRYKLFDRNNPAYPAKIILDRNFRSREGITDACNFVFSSLMSPEIGGLDYNDEEKLVCGADYPNNSAPNMELLLIDGGDVNKEEEETNTQLEAQLVAEKILKMMYEEKTLIKDENSERKLEYRDIAILLRSAKGDTRRAATFSNVLRQYGIPAVSELKSNFFEENEIKVMLNCLRIIDNPVLDIPLLSVMMSPMFGFTADEMSLIRSKYRRMPIYNAVKLYSKEDEKARDFIEFIDKMRSLAVTVTVDKLIDIVAHSCGYISIVKAISKASARNLYLLRSYARDYSENGYKTLTAFINYIDRMIERGTVLNASDNSSKELNAVTVMSIHASKGLEFPVCFISSTGTKFNFRDTSNDLTLDSVGGVGLRYRENLVKYDTLHRKAVSMMLKDSQMSEEMRILYVALTRAKERLIITSVQNNPDEYLSKLANKITSYPPAPFVVKSASSFSDWLFTCALFNSNCNAAKALGLNTEANDGTALPWVLSSVSRPEFSDGETPVANPEELEIERNIPDGFMEKFRQRLAFKYKNKPLSSLPQKVSASELSHKDNKIFNKVLRRPSFLDAESASGAESGTAFHTFMERCDLRGARKDVTAEADRLAADGYLTERMRSLLDLEKLGAFLNSELIDRVLRSERYYREFTFTVKIKAADYNPEIAPEFSDRELIMQGAVDLAFVENGELVIVDYKTDRVKEAEKLREMYRKQVELYKQALEETLGLSVKETIIYSVHLNKSIKKEA